MGFPRLEPQVELRDPGGQLLGGRAITRCSRQRLLQCVALSRWIARARNLNIRVLALKPNKGLDEMTKLVEAGSVVPSIDTVYPLSEVPEALRRFGAAEHLGKIVISVE